MTTVNVTLALLEVPSSEDWAVTVIVLTMPTVVVEGTEKVPVMVSELSWTRSTVLGLKSTRKPLSSKTFMTTSVGSPKSVTRKSAEDVFPGLASRSAEVAVTSTWVETGVIGGSKNTNFQNSMGALSNPISFSIRISKQILFSF